jgi:predicted secreted hydrolase
MKISYSILFIILIIFSNYCNGKTILDNERNIDQSDYNIKNITPKDDAFHGINNYYSQEWWYFDAFFNQNYGIHIGIKVISFAKWGIVRELINIYKDTNLEEKELRIRPLNQYKISEEIPNIKYRNKQILEFDYNEYISTGNWNYTIKIELNNIKVDLIFIGKSKGFTYQTTHEGWSVAQPIARVRGKITINEKVINLNGKGYHDHNWNFSIGTGLRGKGWYWGKISSENYSLTWAKVQKTRFADDTISEKIGILSIINDDYIKINSDNITIEVGDYEYHNGRFIPTRFFLYAMQDDIEINVSFNAVSIQKVGLRFISIHYWRFFISIIGFIKHGENVDFLENEIQIMECVRFI